MTGCLPPPVVVGASLGLIVLQHLYQLNLEYELNLEYAPCVHELNLELSAGQLGHHTRKG